MLIIVLAVTAAVCFATLVLAWMVYPRVVIARGAHHPVVRHELETADLPRVSVILATRDDLQAIERRIQNILDCTYPLDKLQLIVALDHSVSDRELETRRSLAARAVVVSGAVPGKASALNAGVRSADSDLFLFVDSAQHFESEAIRRLVGQLQAEQWGALTATLAATSGDDLMDRYWSRELKIRRGQESKHSIICVTGCAYVLRRKYWRPMPDGLICDDLWSTYGTVLQGGRVGIVEDARVTDPRKFTREQEYARRLRTMTGLLQFLRVSPEVLRSSRNPMCIDFVLHKLMRPATPLLLMIAALAILGLLFIASAPVALTVLAVGTLLAIAPFVLAGIAPTGLAKKLQTARFAARLLFMPLLAIRRALSSDWNVWTQHKV